MRQQKLHGVRLSCHGKGFRLYSKCKMNHWEGMWFSFCEDYLVWLCKGNAIYGKKNESRKITI